MASPKRPVDPFAKLADLATDQKLFESHRLPNPPKASEKPATQKPTQLATQNLTQISKKVSTPSHKQSPSQPATEEIEDLAYHLRKVNKVRVNADVPREWKDRLDDLAHQLRVGKYELMLYVIATFLGEEQPPEGGR